MSYDLVVQHPAGLKHTNADALSRRPCRVYERQDRPSMEAECELEEDPAPTRPLVDKISADEAGSQVIVRDLHEASSVDFPQIVLEGWSTEEIRPCQAEDLDISPLVTALGNDSSRPDWDQVSSGRAALKTLWRQCDKLQIKDGVLYCQFHDADLEEDYNRLVVPSSKRPALLRHFHDIPTAGH